MERSFSLTVSVFLPIQQIYRGLWESLFGPWIMLLQQGCGSFLVDLAVILSSEVYVCSGSECSLLRAFQFSF